MRMSEVAQHVAAAHGCTAVVEMDPVNYPVTVNDPVIAEHTLQVAKTLVPEEQVLRMPTPRMGAEDLVIRLAVGARVDGLPGSRSTRTERPAPNHSNRFTIHEQAMATGIAMHTAMALSPTT